MEIRVYGDPVLRKVAEPIADLDEEIQNLAERMLHTMYNADGVGLAAPQVGVLKRLFVVGLPNGEELIIVNPEIREKEGEIVDEEGCLSIPGLRAQVARAGRVFLVGFDLEGRELEIEADGLLARIFQHEIDHLNGVLFIDRLSPARRALIAKKLRSIAERGRDG